MKIKGILRKVDTNNWLVGLTLFQVAPGNQYILRELNKRKGTQTSVWLNSKKILLGINCKM